MGSESSHWTNETNNYTIVIHLARRPMTQDQIAPSLDFFTLEDFNLAEKTVLVRIDINSPVNPHTGKLLSDTRLRIHTETIKRLRLSKVVLLAHQSRPGKADFISLKEHAERLTKIVGRPVAHVDDLLGSMARNAIKNMKSGDIILLENTRLYSEEVVLKGTSMEKQANSHIVKNIAPLVDYFVNDAFAAAHRSQPSLIGFMDTLPTLAGKVMEKELQTLQKILEGNIHPCVAVLGGIKVDDSVTVAKYILEKGIVDILLTSGVVGHTFLKAKGIDLGKVNEKFCNTEVPGYPKLVNDAKELLSKYEEKIRIPIDVAVDKDGKRVLIKVDQLPQDFPIYDLGLDTILSYIAEIKKANLIIINGPAGLFEVEEFSLGTNEIFSATAESKAFSVMGGGETTAVLDRLGLSDRIDHVSTGGGALINLLAGKSMPVVDGLIKSKLRFNKTREENKES